MSTPRLQRRLAAILAADVVGYSRLMGADEAGTLGALRAVWADRFNPCVAVHGGRIVKMMGDGALVEFGSAVDAVECAVAVQSAMAERNAEAEGPAIEFRIGVNLGDIVIEGDDILGDGVNVAARLEAQAPKNGLLVSDAVHAQVRGKVGVTFADAGEIALKNIAAPVRVWRWGGEAPAPVVVADPSPLPVPQVEELPSIAVLPFTNMSNDPEQEYFSDGISEDIITDLSKVAGLMVVARNSSFAYKGRTNDIRVVGRELGVSSVLEGSIRRAGNRVRITAQLIDSRTGGHLWAERFDRDLTDIFAVQDEVTLHIVGALKVTLKPAERARVMGGGTKNLEAHDCILRGREISAELLRTSGSGGAAAVERIIALIERAIELDPEYSEAYAYLAMTYMVEYSNTWTGVSDPLGLAVHFAQIAVEKDPNEPAARNALATALTYRRDLDAARPQSMQAVALNPNFAQGYATLGNLETFMGRGAAAVPLLERAMRLDPVFANLYLHFMGLCHMQSRRFDLAVERLRERIGLAPGTDLSRGLLASALGHLGRIDEARDVWAEVKALKSEVFGGRAFPPAAVPRSGRYRNAGQGVGTGGARGLRCPAACPVRTSR